MRYVCLSVMIFRIPRKPAKRDNLAAELLRARRNACASRLCLNLMSLIGAFHCKAAEGNDSYSRMFDV
jgi:hypothetical protein